MTAKTDTPAPAPDPDAPTRHTLPSGKIVEVRSHRTLLGAEVAAAIAAQTGDGMRSVVDVRNALIAALASELEPGRAGTPVLDGTVAAVLAQRGDDWRVLYGLATEAWRLTMGLSVVPDIDGYEDPKAPTQATSDSGLDSGA